MLSYIRLLKNRNLSQKNIIFVKLSNFMSLIEISTIIFWLNQMIEGSSLIEKVLISILIP